MPAIVLILLTVGCGSLLFVWPEPFKFRSDRSWTLFISPGGAVKDISFSMISETSYVKERLVGGAALWPEDFRNTFFGTHIDGPAFTGIAQSNSFRLSSPSYIVPFAGYPISAGNFLHLQIVDDKGNIVEEIPCPGPNPGSGLTDVGFWEIDVRRHVGKMGRLVMQDQRADAEGWVAVAPPYPASNSPKINSDHRRFWIAQGTLSGLQSLQVICATLGVLAAISLFPPARRLLC